MTAATVTGASRLDASRLGRDHFGAEGPSSRPPWPSFGGGRGFLGRELLGGPKFRLARQARLRARAFLAGGSSGPNSSRGLVSRQRLLTWSLRAGFSFGPAALGSRGFFVAVTGHSSFPASGGMRNRQAPEGGGGRRVVVTGRDRFRSCSDFGSRSLWAYRYTPDGGCRDREDCCWST